MPVLQQAHLDQPGVDLLFVNQGEFADKVSAWLQARKLAMRNRLMDGYAQTATAFKQRALPMTLFFDAKGQRVSMRIGEHSSATLTKRLETLHA